MFTSLLKDVTMVVVVQFMIELWQNVTYYTFQCPIGLYVSKTFLFCLKHVGYLPNMLAALKEVACDYAQQIV